jgi:DNA polymerase III epsilon subunit family exonuclease
MINLNAELEKVKWNNVPSSFVVFDLETTGLDPKTDRVIEIGAVYFDKENYIKTGEIKTFQCFVKQDKKIPIEATKINKITDEMIINGEDEYTALELFFDFVGSNDLYAYNAKFDKSFINAMAKRSMFSHVNVADEVFDIMKFIKEEWIIKPNYKLTTVAKHLKIEVKDAHRAVGDSILALKSYIQIIQMLNMSQRKYDLEREEWNRNNLSIYKNESITDKNIRNDSANDIENNKKDSSETYLPLIFIAILVIFLLAIVKILGK